MTVNVFIMEKDGIRAWSGLGKDDRERISEMLNSQALTAIGYEAEKEKSAGSKAQGKPGSEPRALREC